MRAVWVAFSVSVIALLVAPAHADEEEKCNAWDIVYETKPTLQITDTKMGGGDGIWATGPARVVVRFSDVGGAPGGDAKLLDWRERDKFTLSPSTILGSATITTDNLTVAVPDKCGVVAEGTLDSSTLKWKAAWNVRSHGSIACSGGLCGAFGAPKSGTTPMSSASHGVTFQPFVFGADMKTFKMASTVVGSQKDPRQTSHLSFTGKETQRACVVARPCP